MFKPTEEKGEKRRESAARFWRKVKLNLAEEEGEAEADSEKKERQRQKESGNEG